MSTAKEKGGIILNLEYLNGRINEIKIPITIIAERMGISRQSLYLKIKGEREFKVSEVSKLCDILRLTDEEKTFVFLQMELTKLTTLLIESEENKHE